MRICYFPEDIRVKWSNLSHTIKIASFAEGWYNQGHQTVIWNYLKGISSGQYTCIIHHDNSITTSVFTIIQ